MVKKLENWGDVFYGCSLSNSHKLWLNMATKVDGNTFNVSYMSWVLNLKVDERETKNAVTGRPLTTPTRFQKIIDSGWNDGIEAICFTVDRNISIMGCCVYPGKQNVNYDLDLYDFSDETNPRKLQGGIVGGIFTVEDTICVGGIAMLKFAKAIPVKPNVKYAIRWYHREHISKYGQNGKQILNGPDGTKFNLSSTKYFYSGGRTSALDGQIPQILYYTQKKVQTLPFNTGDCGAAASLGSPVKLETADGMTFFLVGRKQCDTLRFWVYFVGSFYEAKHYSYTLTVTNNAGDKKYTHQGKVFTLDSGESVEGSVFMMDANAAKKICDEDSKLIINVLIRNLKEEAKDDDVESGVSEGED